MLEMHKIDAILKVSVYVNHVATSHLSLYQQ